MPTQVESPVTRKGSKVSGNIAGSSPGAFSNPSRGDATRAAHSVPNQPARGSTSRHSEPSELEPRLKVTGPED
jgi:hypothetical protein